MTKLVITRGLPGCGKTTVARAWVAEDPKTRIRVNRDDTRTMFHAGRLGTQDQERQVSVARDASVAALLRKGWDVVCDDTTLQAGTPETCAGSPRWPAPTSRCGT